MFNHDTVKNTLQSIIQEVALQRQDYVYNPGKDFTRNRVLTFEKMLSCLISMDEGSIHRELLRFFDFSNETPSSSAFVQQRSKIKTSAFETVFQKFTSSFETKSYKGYHLLACDGSIITFPLDDDEKKEEYAYIRKYEGQKDYYQMHLNALYDLQSNQYVDAYIEPRKHSNERKALSIMLERKHIPAKSIIIADRGYESYPLIAQIQQSGHFYLIRVKNNSDGGMIKSFPLPKEGEYDETLTYTYTYRRGRDILTQPEKYKVIHYKPSPYFLNSNNPFYEMTIRFVKIKLSNGEYECLITNLPASDFSALEIGKLYNMRWGIETSFRTLKYTVGLLYFHSKKADFVKQEIWSRLIMYNVFAIITFNASSGKEKEKKYRYQPNLTDALHICRQFLKNHVATKDLDCLILGLLLPIRPDRQAPRKKKNHFSIGFLYRTV